MWSSFTRTLFTNMSKCAGGRLYRSNLSSEMEADLICEETASCSTDDDESISVLSQSMCSQSLKRKLPASPEYQVESARQNSQPRTLPLQSCPDERDVKLVSEWSVDEVKSWVLDVFGRSELAKNFEDEEIDGRILLSSMVRTDEAMEKLGLNTLGKKGKFLQKTAELAGNSQTKASTFKSASDPAVNLHPKTDRLLTQHEKKHLTCENKRIYNTKKKMIVAEVNKEWPLNEEVPSFRPHHTEEIQKLNKFVKRLSEGKESSKYTFEECGLGQNAIREMVMMQMRERRRGNKDRELHQSIKGSQETTSDESHHDTESVSDSSSSSSTNPSPLPSQLPSRKKAREYSTYFHPGMTQTSCEVVVLAMLNKNSIRDVQVDKHLRPLKKLFNLTLLRGQDKNTYVRAIANALFMHKYISFKNTADTANLTREDINILRSL